ncbi:MAG: class I SAM-dependent methyltransferase [Bacteroidetes bacterium]|nr:class I SAM-dependent methyltransferase [Bacteroidota bacterium]
MLLEIQEIYSKIWPCSLDDRDIRDFLGTLYLATLYFKPRIVIQTGTFVGTSSVAIALGLKENNCGLLYTIDPEPQHYFGVSRPVSVARSVALNGDLAARVRFVRGYSTIPGDTDRMEITSAPNWRLLEISRKTRHDMLVVDGDHTFTGCYLDLVYGTLGLAQDGPRLIIGHDYLGIHDVHQSFIKWKTQLNGFIFRVVPSPCGIALIQLD